MRDALLPAASDLGAQEADFLLIAIFVRLQHQRPEEAKVLIDGALAAGLRSPEIAFASAVVENTLGNHTAALEAVALCEEVEPAKVNLGAKTRRRLRMRSYIKARSLYALHGELGEDGRAALDFYMRQSGPA
ncbi:hypothetical protein [Phaeobacter sp. HF9A]|uniref:hypothetical protein n=1 Tax=Phaeobacter sp. HF9A TaxID=2721561 RepID=UPI0014311C63|nr:hypothetical protein [Phaeobacter sp. HF9A]NIZ12001.1 hypothetical protein [Phaeobacter sp. HF9A]